MECLQSVTAVAQRRLGHRRQVARYHERAAHPVERRLRGHGDGVHQEAVQGALPHLADQEPQQIVALVRGRLAHQRLQPVGPPRPLAFEFGQGAVDVPHGERRGRCRGQLAQPPYCGRPDSQAALAEPPGQEAHAGGKRFRLGVIGKRPQALGQRLDLGAAAARGAHLP